MQTGQSRCYTASKPCQSQHCHILKPVERHRCLLPRVNLRTFAPRKHSSRRDKHGMATPQRRACISAAGKGAIAEASTRTSSQSSQEQAECLQVIGEGYHPKAGEPHAEVFALRAAGQQAKDATAYVTLEPCNHYGKTPPCSQALVDAQVAKVFVGVRDPNPLVNNAGVDTLTKAGIEVAYIGGEEERECYDINADFMERMSPK